MKKVIFFSLAFLLATSSHVLASATDIMDTDIDGVIND